MFFGSEKSPKQRSLAGKGKRSLSSTARDVFHWKESSEEEKKSRVMEGGKRAVKRERQGERQEG